MISGDKAKMEVDDATNMGFKTSIQECLILEHDTEPLVMGVQWHSSLVGKNCGDSTRLVNMDAFGTSMANPLGAIEDETEEEISCMMRTWMSTQRRRQRKNRII